VINRDYPVVLRYALHFCAAGGLVVNLVRTSSTRSSSAHRPSSRGRFEALDTRIGESPSSGPGDPGRAPASRCPRGRSAMRTLPFRSFLSGFSLSPLKPAALEQLQG
jgi:hypothetical protein